MDLKIPGYEVFEVIGSGGMAEVYRARHLRLDREVALKVMLSRYADDNSFCERFIREARIAAKLSHPHIVQIYDVNRYEKTLFLSMEYIKGGDLTHRMHIAHNKDDVKRAVTELAYALDYAHDLGYVHRDIKPANILFRENDSLALSDFGIARAMHSETHMTQTGMVVGTPSYMSPEQAQGKDLKGSSDLYSLAVIAYQLVAGKLPYQSESSISVAIKHISDPIPTLPAALSVMQPFFNRALAKAPEDRFLNGQELAEHFSSAIGQIESLSPPSEETTVLSSKPEIPPPSSTEFDAFTLQEEHASELETQAFTPPPSNTQQNSEQKPFTLAAPKHSNKTNRVFWIIGVVIIGIAGAFGLSSGLLDSPEKLSPAQEIRLAQLLLAADEDLSNDRLYSPAGNNAYEKYLAMQAISPKDPVAQDGLENLLTKAIDKIDRLGREGKTDKAQSILNVVLSIHPSNSALKDISKELQKKEAQQKESDRTIFANAELNSQERRDKDAIEGYSSLLTSDEYADRARLGLIKIARSNFADAEKQHSSGKTTGIKEKVDLAILAANAAKKPEIAVQARKLLASPQKKTVAAKPKTHTPVVKNTATSWNKRGEKAFLEGRLDSPAKNNAYYFYSKALDLNPDNAATINGLNAVFDKIISLSNAAADRGDVPLANIYVNRLENIAPGHIAIRQLRHRIVQVEREEARKAAAREKVMVLYGRADTYLAAGRAKSADKIYRKIEQLSPGDPGLKTLGAKIADSYVGLAQREIDAKQWRDVSVWVERGLKHVPNHKKLIEMRTFANQQIQNSRK